MTLIRKLRLGDRIRVGPDVVLIVTRADSDNRLTLAIDAPSSWTIERARRDGSVPCSEHVSNVISVALDSRD